VRKKAAAREMFQLIYRVLFVASFTHTHTHSHGGKNFKEEDELVDVFKCVQMCSNVYLDISNQFEVTASSIIFHRLSDLISVLELISPTFYSRIFCLNVGSKPNSKQRKAAQESFVQNMRA